MGNYVRAIYYALAHTYQYLSPDMWPLVKLGQSPYQQWSDFLKGQGKTGPKKAVEV
jgi:small subunit ribosomal protein S2e